MASAPPGYAPTSAPGGYSPGGPGPGMFPQQGNPFGGQQHAQRQEPPQQQPPKKKKKSLWDAFMGDLSKKNREEKAAPQGGQNDSGVPIHAGQQGGSGNSPLAAYGNMETRLQMSEGVLRQAPPGFRVEDGVVVPNDAKLKKARRSRPGLGGGRWQRFAFTTAMLLAMVLLMVLGITRLVGGALVKDPELPPGTNFPREAASGYSAQLAKLYYSWNEQNPLPRSQALAVYFPLATTDKNFGWNGKGSQTVSDIPVTMRVETQSDKSALIINGMTIITDPGTQNQKESFVCSAVSVKAPAKNSMAVDAYPSLVACPQPANIGVDDVGIELDDELPRSDVRAIQTVVEQFFRAYAASNTALMRQFLTGSAGINTGMGANVQVESVPPPLILKPKKGDPENQRTVQAKVFWRQAGAGQSVNRGDYVLTVQRQGSNWVIAKLRPTVPSADLAPVRDSDSEGNNPSPSPSPSDQAQNTDTQQTTGTPTGQQPVNGQQPPQTGQPNTGNPGP